MADIFTKQKRSEVMSKIRGKNTKPELAVFRELRIRAIYFQKHYRKAPGSPDIALPKKKIAIFIDGDFWHGYRFGTWRHRLSSDYWVRKIERNRARDIRNFRRLRRNDWVVFRVWEHQIQKEFDMTIEKIVAVLSSG
ncbi:very short patch repair endonuclease [Candidatus Uhrbacteria bacterium]|nr:very short patch repair endonuclease [Candidatus Uhrbacteria bacterium]